jgi:hypothetical protein
METRNKPGWNDYIALTAVGGVILGAFLGLLAYYVLNPLTTPDSVNCEWIIYPGGGAVIMVTYIGLMRLAIRVFLSLANQDLDNGELPRDPHALPSFAASISPTPTLKVPALKS